MTDHILAGVTVPVMTPLGADGRPDDAATVTLLTSLADTGVDSVLLLGSNGEGALLPPDLTRRFVRMGVELWHELRPAGSVVVNVSAPGTTETLRRAETALEGAPDALLVTPPSYFAHRADEIEQHLRAIEQLGHPWAIYNVPKYASALTAEVLGAVLDCPHLVGLKDSSGDLTLLRSFVAVIAERPDLALSQGDERNLAEGLRSGAKGIVPGLANIVPSLIVSLRDATAAGRHQEADALQERVTSLTGVHAIRPGVPTVKAILHDRGVLPNDRCAPPLRSVDVDELERLRHFLSPFEPWLIRAVDSPLDSHQERPT
ncbi:dihydrodipicolinate synthase family protein [Protaetiibacter mangrovi]|uniref:Dihydrodipicolinate synthase family protein n=1 Tax=Protaetiibacter mangrovi TaxID=2970926 RepID=A0ABT1ZGS7_9MICO|nr:dihydrodipicolinate synthase family protein [Protaetiibacter mangrovi]MCS0499916.1 dihydrodipicolinate synthase family protein [Protaetiibacter mangrovi]TPX02724.1 dihydrodipicolinate synthase family protein [Schumannella luteola]